MNTTPHVTTQFPPLLPRLGEGPVICSAEKDRKPGSPPAMVLLMGKIVRGITWVLKNVKVQPARKSLRVCETVSLGERRFVAVVQVDEERYLIGGGTGSVSLLSRLPDLNKSASTCVRSAGNEIGQ